jgi:hypothetical protein
MVATGAVLGLLVLLGALLAGGLLLRAEAGPGWIGRGGEPGSFSALLGTALLANHPHNLSASGTGHPIHAVSETQICIFCHTPHHAYVQTLVNGANINAPLWNHHLSEALYTVKTAGTVTTGTANKIYNSPELAGTYKLLSQPLNPPDGASKLCLSCHDGTVAVGALFSRTAVVEMTGVTAEGYIPSGSHAYIGTDLTTHHVVSVPYTTQLVSNSSAECEPPEGSGTSTLKLEAKATVLQDPVVALRPTGAQYGSGYEEGNYNWGVQCSTCHDPHTWVDPSGYAFCNTCNFLVEGCADIKGSGTDCNYIDTLCAKCHIPCN